jgi:hypothetical protein
VPLKDGTRPAFSHAVVLYEVPGYHSPLTKTQIAELFRAGRVGRNHPCKQISQKEWRTVDELFPLLKYQPPTINCYEPWQPVRRSPIDRTVVLACTAVALAIAALWFYLAHDSSPTSSTYRARASGTRWTTTNSTSETRVPFVAPERPPEERRPHQQQWQTNGVAANSIVITPEVRVVANTRPVDSAAQQREAQEQQRRQAELARLQEERAKQEQRARGEDVIIPLDQYRVVNVGGVGVSVMIHDNDVTSFDVWINGLRHREVPKQKGITQSRTDETLIYDNSRARLYYVWEISGELNHCRLRVRED